jgi:hypothetical protein
MSKKSAFIAGQRSRRRTDVLGENSGINAMFAAGNLSVARELMTGNYGSYTQRASRHIGSLR